MTGIRAGEQMTAGVTTAAGEEYTTGQDAEGVTIADTAGAAPHCTGTCATGGAISAAAIPTQWQPS